MSEGREGITFICHYGLERSRAAAQAFRDLGVSADHFVGGTKKIANMPIDELKNNLSKNTYAILIYDQRSKDEEYNNKQIATEKLDKLGISYEVVDSAALAIMLFDRGKNLDDYL